MKSLIAFVCAAGLGAASVAAQAPQSPQGNQPGAQQSQPSTQGKQESQPSAQGKQDKPQALQNVVTMTGCVYQTSDQPTVFAIRRMEMGTQQQAEAKGAAGAEGKVQGLGGDAATRRDTSKPSAAGGQNTEGAWYRLNPSATEDLKRYAGQRVRVNGQLTPGRDPQGNDVVIHRITPEKTVVTTIDLQPAPQLSIASITPLEGSCDSGAGKTGAGAGKSDTGAGKDK